MLAVLALFGASTLPSTAESRDGWDLLKTPFKDFSLQDLSGRKLRASDLRGKVVVVDFWATWCQPCLDEIDEYNRFHREYGSKVRFLALASESGTVPEVRTAVKELKIQYPVSVPTPKQLDAFGEIEVLPTTWVIGRDGTVVKEIQGVPAGKHGTLRALVDDLLAKK